MLDFPAAWLESGIDLITNLPWADGTFFTHAINVRALLATLVVCLICGALGSLVVGNRMAFFSDALAHCAFAGVGFGLLLCLLVDASDDHVRQWITLIMVAFGILIGLLIAFVRDQTGLANDTVIGVFYAASIGIGAVVTRIVSSGRRRFFSIEDFIFGNPLSAKTWEILLLIGLAIGVGVVLYLFYNSIVLASANPSLALSRRVPVRLSRYLFIVLLALMVNLSQQITGTLLINGLLIVPAATAANLASNLRQMFWFTIVLSLFVGLAGSLLSWEISCQFHQTFTIGISGTIVVLSVLLFVLSAFVGRLVRRA